MKICATSIQRKVYKLEFQRDFLLGAFIAMLFIYLVGCGSKEVSHWSEHDRTVFMNACTENDTVSFCNCVLSGLEPEFTEAEVESWGLGAAVPPKATEVLKGCL